MFFVQDKFSEYVFHVSNITNVRQDRGHFLVYLRKKYFEFMAHSEGENEAGVPQSSAMGPLSVLFQQLLDQFSEGSLALQATDWNDKQSLLVIRRFCLVQNVLCNQVNTWVVFFHVLCADVKVGWVTSLLTSRGREPLPAARHHGPLTMKEPRSKVYAAICGHSLWIYNSKEAWDIIDSVRLPFLVP